MVLCQILDPVYVIFMEVRNKEDINALSVRKSARNLIIQTASFA